MPASFLVNADADAVQDYIFATPDLKMVRGASRIQTYLNRVVLPRDAVRLGGHVISANGGTVLARFPDRDRANVFCEFAERTYREHTHSAGITTVIEAYEPGDFEEALNRSKRQLEKLKNQRCARRPEGSEPFWASCEACGLHPACGYSKYEGILCRACQLRESFNHIRARFDAPDMDWIGKQSRPENYIAFIYLDLDRMGRWLPDEARNSEKEFSRLSKTVERAVRTGINGAVKQLDRKSGLSIFEIFLVGGDDGMVAVPADRCFDFLRKFEEVYHRAFRGGSAPRVSVGMVIAHSHFPIAEFVRIAKKLVRSAKTIPEDNSIDYEIITSSMTGDVIKNRQPVKGTGDGHWRTGKPYRLDEFLKRERQIVELKKSAPASKMRSLYQIAYRGLFQASLEYLWLLQRSNEATRALLRDAVGASIWQTDMAGKHFSRAADIAELWEFVHEEPRCA